MELVVSLCTFVVCCYVLASLTARWVMRRDRRWSWQSKDGNSSFELCVRRDAGSKETI